LETLIGPVRASFEPRRKRDQIVQMVTRLVAFGTIKQNAALPSVRSLAESLCVNKATVMDAYHTLIAQGIIAHRPRLQPVVGSTTIAQQVIVTEIKVKLESALADARALGWDREQIKPLIASLEEGS
jgi:DNA-binding transcriptional regulator YhcF (GntR family)